MLRTRRLGREADLREAGVMEEARKGAGASWKGVRDKNATAAVAPQALPICRGRRQGSPAQRSAGFETNPRSSCRRAIAAVVAPAVACVAERAVDRLTETEYSELQICYHTGFSLGAGWREEGRNQRTAMAPGTSKGEVCRSSPGVAALASSSSSILTDAWRAHAGVSRRGLIDHVNALVKKTRTSSVLLPAPPHDLVC